MDWKKLWPVLVEAGKEPLRLLALAIIPVLIAHFTNVDQTWAVIAVFVLRILDKVLHEYGKVIKDDSLILGLTRF